MERRWKRAFVSAVFTLSEYLDFDIIEFKFSDIEVTVTWLIGKQQYRQSFFIERTISDLEYYFRLKEVWPTEFNELVGLRLDCEDTDK